MIQLSAIERYWEQDYLMGGTDLITLPPFPFSKRKIQYSQLDVPEGSYQCVPTSNMIAAANNLWIDFSLEERIKIRDLSEQYWRVHRKGMWLYKWVDLVRNYINENKNIKVETRQVKNGSKLFYELLDRGFILNTWGLVNRKYVKYLNNDWIITSSESSSLWGDRYWHAFCIYKDWVSFIIENYPEKLKYNIIEIESLENLMKDVLFDNSYIYMEKRDVSNIDIPEAIEWLKMGLWNGENANEPMTRQEVIAVIVRALKKD